MYGFPRSLEPTEFVGLRLSSVTFSENTIHVAFGDEVSVTILGSVIYRTSSGAEEVSDSPPVASSTLVSLIGRLVEAGEVVESRRDMLLTLEQGARMRLTDDSTAYESFIVNIRGTEFIV